MNDSSATDQKREPGSDTAGELARDLARYYMTREEWAKTPGSVTWLLTRYADGRTICNCGNAYYSDGGEYLRTGPNGTTRHYDGKYCKGGCASAQISAIEHVAQMVAIEAGFDVPGYKPYAPAISPASNTGQAGADE